MGIAFLCLAGVSLVVSVLGRKFSPAAMTLTLATLVPYGIAVNSTLPLLGPIYPVAISVILASAVTYVRRSSGKRPKSYSPGSSRGRVAAVANSKTSRWRRAFGILLALFTFCLLVSQMSSNWSRPQAFTLGLLLPAVLGLLWVAEMGSMRASSAARAFVVIGTLQSVLALLQVIFGMTLSWSVGVGDAESFRPSGLFDQALILASFLVICIPLCFFLRKTLHVTSCVLLLFAGVLATESRFAVAVSLVAILILIALRGAGSGGRMAATIGAVSGAGALLVSPIGAGLLERFGSDQGSTYTRQRANEAFLIEVKDRLFSGSGIGSSYEVGRRSGLYSSFENAFFMVTIDVGLVGAVALYLALVVVVIMSWSGGKSERAFGAALGLAIVLSFGSSSVATITASPYILASLLGICIGLRCKPVRSSLPINTQRADPNSSILLA